MGTRCVLTVAMVLAMGRVTSTLSVSSVLGRAPPALLGRRHGIARGAVAMMSMTTDPPAPASGAYGGDGGERSARTAGGGQRRKGAERLQTTGGLKKLPMARPANEIVSSARRKSWQEVKPDTSVKNARQRARKYGAMQLDMLTKELGVPLRDIVQGYKRQLRILHPYEAVVADLTVRALEKSGHTTLTEVLEKVRPRGRGVGVGRWRRK